MRPGDTWHVTFALTGAATGTPTAKLLHNGAADTTVGSAGVLSASAGADANEWTVAVTIPSSGYAAGDTLELSATATVSGVTQSDVRARAYIDAPVVASSVTGNVAGSVGSLATPFGPVMDSGAVVGGFTLSTTQFTATGALNGPSGVSYTVLPMTIFWQTGRNQGVRYPITAHSASGSNHSFTVAAMPFAAVAGETFVVI